MHSRTLDFLKKIYLYISRWCKISPVLGHCKSVKPLKPCHWGQSPLFMGRFWPWRCGPSRVVPRVPTGPQFCLSVVSSFLKSPPILQSAAHGLPHTHLPLQLQYSGRHCLERPLAGTAVRQFKAGIRFCWPGNSWTGEDGAGLTERLVSFIFFPACSVISLALDTKSWESVRGPCCALVAAVRDYCRGCRPGNSPKGYNLDHSARS